MKRNRKKRHEHMKIRNQTTKKEEMTSKEKPNKVTGNHTYKQTQRLINNHMKNMNRIGKRRKKRTMPILMSYVDAFCE